jgi:hypothetical protein
MRIVGIRILARLSTEVNEASHPKIERRLRSSRRITMKENADTYFAEAIRRVALTMVVLGIAAAPTVYAGPNSISNSGNPANLVAHVQLNGGPATRMLLVKKNGKEYLVLGLDSSRATVLDVSQPDQPRSIDTAAGNAEVPVAEVRVVADTLTLFGTPDTQTSSSSNPKEIRSLSGVTAFMKDKTRGLIYATNGDGLWIIKTKQQAYADALPDYSGN